jgi:lysozyme
MVVRLGCFAALLAMLTGCWSGDGSSWGRLQRGGRTDSLALGIDVSAAQGDIDWGSAGRGGVDFAFARVSDGTGAVDATLDQNWAGMAAGGLVRGAYQVFRPEQDPGAQATVFLDAVKQAGGFSPGDLPAVLDLNDLDGVSPSAAVTGAQAWVTAVEAATGHAPMIFTSPAFWNELGDPATFSADPLWVADWGASTPEVPSGSWQSWQFWQVQDNVSRIPGLAGDADLDAFNGGPNDLANFASAGSSTQMSPGMQTPAQMQNSGSASSD